MRPFASSSIALIVPVAKLARRQMTRAGSWKAATTILEDLSFRLGDSAVEMRVPRASLGRYSKTDGPFEVWAKYAVWDNGASSDPTDHSPVIMSWL